MCKPVGSGSLIIEVFVTKWPISRNLIIICIGYGNNLKQGKHGSRVLNLEIFKLGVDIWQTELGIRSLRILSRLWLLLGDHGQTNVPLWVNLINERWIQY